MPERARVLVTGSSGFIGRHLVRTASVQGATVAGLSRGRIRRGEEDGVAARFLGDIRNAELVARVLGETGPTHIFHLAGLLPGEATDSAALYDVNVVGTARLLDAIVAAGLKPVVVINSSSAVYGRAQSDESAVDETARCEPLTHYAVSKLGQEMLGRLYHDVHGVHVIIARTFNLVGPGQSETLLASGVAREIAEAEGAERPALVHVGSLTPRRDFLDVRDATKAYWLLAERGRAGEVYNVCSGRSYAAQDCVDVLAGLARVPVQVRQEMSRVRQGEIPSQVGSAERLCALTGWEPRIPLATSLEDLLDDWRAHGQAARHVDHVMAPEAPGPGSRAPGSGF